MATNIITQRLAKTTLGKEPSSSHHGPFLSHHGPSLLHREPSKQTPTVSDRIEIQLRIPDQQMAKQIMDKTIALLQKTANETADPNEKAQALQCIQLIRRDNPQLVALGK